MQQRGMENEGERKVILDLTNKTFAEKVRIKRTYDGLTQMELADKLGLNIASIPVISRVERNRPGTPHKYIQLLEQYVYGE
ncbi:hypothetical protein ABE244_28175 [Bacillus toyonensis]|uniref:helix-turn-helix domain-containing protein n=1 Tax=Bacillus toyonensis TaxID=155322 RepID=UPI003D1B6947